MKPVRRRSLLFRLAVGFVVLVALLGVTAVVVPPLLWGGGDYSKVVSIKGAREYQDPALMAKAWTLPVAAIYQRDGIDFQSNPSFCGPTSVVNVMRSLGQPAEQQHVLDGTPFHTTLGMLWGGMTLDQVADLVRAKTGRTATVLRDLDLAAFRAELRHANDPSRRYILNFNRGPLFATGGGHFSPVAGYLVAEDLVLVLDVNAKYQPWLVPTARLFDAVDTVDRSTKKKRGLLRVE
jgi:hypothetical protein